MLPESAKRNVRHSSYWERPYTKWRVSTWDEFYSEKYPNASRQESHNSLGDELEVLINELKPKTKEHDMALAVKRNLEVSIFTFLEM